MMKSCPECGSTEIVSDLLVFADEALNGLHPPYVKLLEPKPEKAPFIWRPNTVTTGFRVSICGSCGYTRVYTKDHAAMLEAHKKGYVSQQSAMNIVSL